MAIVSIAIVISFHLKHEPTPLERRVALPFGIVFWLLALACLASGTANYIKTVTKYSRRQALVQSGWKTQVVSLFPFSDCLFSSCSFYSRYLVDQMRVGQVMTADACGLGLYGCGDGYCGGLCTIPLNGRRDK